MTLVLNRKNWILYALMSMVFLVGCSKGSNPTPGKTPAVTQETEPGIKNRKRRPRKTRKQAAAELAASHKAMCESKAQVSALAPSACKGRKAGDVLSTEVLIDHPLNKDENEEGWSITDLIKLLNDLAQGTGRAIDPPSYGARVLKVLYCSPNPCGELVRVSGSAYIPLVESEEGSKPLDSPLPLLSYQHATMALKVGVPSNPQELESLGLSAGAAGFGFAAVAADYLGLGESEGIHPYLHAKTEASAAVDLIKAFRKVAKKNGVKLSNDLYIGGYSQGGHATMALHRSLETEDSAGFNIIASAPMAGPHDLSASKALDAFESAADSASFNSTYLVLGMREAYGLFLDVKTAIQDSIADEVVEKFTAGVETNDEIQEWLPKKLEEIFLPGLVSAVKLGSSRRVPFLFALEQNSVYDWAPKAPMKLLHGNADVTVPFSHSEKAHRRMHELGATQVELIDVGPYGHRDAILPAFVQAVNWFHDLKKQREEKGAETQQPVQLSWAD